jgi:Ca2+-binding RTX toxin-like protein
MAGATLVLSAVLAAAVAAGGSPRPPCAEGPVATGKTIQGTPCDDLIVVGPGVRSVRGGGGNDTIVPAAIAAAESCPAGCHLDIGSQTFEGGPGDDVVYGERGNDRLFGGEGNDQLFGGIGDDLLMGGPGNDRLLGGFGFDSIDGEAGDDYVRGDATIDALVDRGGGTDTLSFSTGITPGFPNNPGQGYPDFSAYPGFPGAGGERGAYVDLSGTIADDGVSPFGGGVDTVEPGEFEILMGTPFSDYIVGSGGNETIYGGGGGDVILGAGGDDSLFGGADGDHLDGGPGSNTLDGGPGSDHCASPSPGTACEPGNTGGVVLRDPSKVGVGLMAPGSAQLYLSGSDSGDEVTATYAPGPSASVTFTLGAGSAPFDAGPSASAGCDPPGAGQVVCPLPGPLDSVVLAGLGGDDVLSASGFPGTAGVVLLGGEGDDTLTGGEESEDVIVDGPDASGPGDDVLSALGGDDALTNNGGADRLFGGTGNDLFLSDSVCDGDLIDGEGERDNASWAKFKGSGVGANLGSGEAGRPGSAGAPQCGGEPLDSLAAVEDLEGTVSGDVFYGGPDSNQLLGWAGPDAYSAGAGTDRILANSGDSDPEVDCGEGADVALVDRPPFEDVVANCETVQPADPNIFRVETKLEEPVTPPGPPPPTVEKPDGIRPAAPSGPSCLGTTRFPGSVRTARCSVRPPRLRIREGVTVKRLQWLHWGARRALGFGELDRRVEGRALVANAKLVAIRPRICNSRRWLTRLTISYGPGFHRSLGRRLASPTPCG